MKTVFIHMGFWMNAFIQIWIGFNRCHFSVDWPFIEEHCAIILTCPFAVFMSKNLAKMMEKYEHYVPTWSRCYWQRQRRLRRRRRWQRQRRRQQTMLLVHDVDNTIHNQWKTTKITLYKSEISCMVGCFRWMCACTVAKSSLRSSLVNVIVYKYGHLVRTNMVPMCACVRCVCSVCVSEKSSYDWITCMGFVNKHL